jgi:hypothetical protein
MPRVPFQPVITRKPRTQAGRRQAQTAVGSSAAGAPSEEAQRFIAHHVRVALDDRSTVLQQVAGIEAMLDGRDPRAA